ncbi:hypothetical protein BJX64DRAFT_265692 [Aspergillus heterothallicus]
MATVPRQRYDPSQQALTGDYRRSILEPVSQYTDAKRHTWLTVRLTAWGNARLWERCSTQLQREVWRYPCYEFVVRQNKITIKRVCTLFLSYFAFSLSSVLPPQKTPYTQRTHCGYR